MDSDNKNDKQTSNWIIVILALAAVVLGYVFFSGLGVGDSDSDTPRAPSGVQQGSGEMPNDAGESVPTDVRVQLLSFSPQDATEQEKAEHFQRVQQYARTSDTLSVSECSVAPFVWKVSSMAVYAIRNAGEENSVLFIGPTPLTIAAGERQQLTITEEMFPSGPGVYAYGCGTTDGQNDAAGIILVE